MNCLLCGREAPYDLEDGAPPDSYCPRCKPWEESHTLFNEWFETVAYLDDVLERIQYAIEARELPEAEHLRYLGAVIKAIGQVPTGKETDRAV